MSSRRPGAWAGSTRHGCAKTTNWCRPISVSRSRLRWKAHSPANCSIPPSRWMQARSRGDTSDAAAAQSRGMRLGVRPSAQNNAGIDAAKTEAVRDRVCDRNVPGLPADQIDALGERIRIFEIEGWRRDLVANGKDGENRLQSAGGSQQMPGG